MKKIMIAGSKYTAKDGTEKTNWTEVGVIMVSQAGKEFVLLDPTINLAGFPREIGKDKLIASIFEDKSQQSNYQQGGYQQQPAQQQPQQPYNNGQPTQQTAPAYTPPVQQTQPMPQQPTQPLPQIDVDSEQIPF